MAKHLKKIAHGLLIAAALPIACAWAEVLTDPTLPPAMGKEDSLLGQSGGPILQSVIQGPGQKLAVISGQVVKVGQKFQEAILIQVTDRSAVLRYPDSTIEELQLYPVVDKKAAASRKSGDNVKTGEIRR